eukprot:m51a1_g8544 putative adenylate guanylate cyclase (2281) ;mRNA; f:55795-65869
MRSHLLAALFAIVAVAAAVLAVTFVVASRQKIIILERAQAAQEARTFLGVLRNKQAGLKSLVNNYAWLDSLYGNMIHQNNHTWRGYTEDLRQRDMQAWFFFLNNGTMLNGIMWNADHTDLVAASPTLIGQVSARLVLGGVADGLYWIPETSSAVILVSDYIRMTDGSGKDVGWLVMSRNLFSVLPRVAQVADICAALLFDTSGFGGIESVWKGRPVMLSDQTAGTQPSTAPLAPRLLADRADCAEGAVGSVVASPSAFSGARLACSSNANSTHGSYLAIGLVLCDENGAPRVRVLIRGIRNDAPTIESTIAFMVIICCCSLLAIFVLVCLLMEFFVLRVLARLSQRIVDVSSSAVSVLVLYSAAHANRTHNAARPLGCNQTTAGQRLKVTGKSELRNVTHAVNELLAALESKTEQTEHILRSIYPEEVLGRIKRGESNNLTFPETTVLFVDICNFTLWSSALTPEAVTQYLNGLFSAMDEIVYSHGATKVMTIGDAYVAACGVSPEQHDGPSTIMAIAFKFTRLCAGKIMDQSEQPLAFRMGVATGQCSSAMIGLKKRFLELWGPSVTLSQQLQESASPGEVVCCPLTKRGLEQLGGGLYHFEQRQQGADDSGATREAWTVAPAPLGDTPCTRSDSQLSLSSPGLLSIVALDAGIAFPADPRGRRCARALRSLRLGAVAGVAALVAVSVVALVVFLTTTLDAATAKLMDRRAVVDATRVSHALQSSLDELRSDAAAWSGWEIVASFITDGDPHGPLWESMWANGLVTTAVRLDGGVFLALNGTVVNGIGYDYPSWAQRNISDAELAVLRGFLVGRLITTGLLYDPVSFAHCTPLAPRLAIAHGLLREAARAVVVYPVMNTEDYPVTGWLVFYRDIKRLLPAMAQMTHMCLGVLQTEQGTPGPLRGLWGLLAEERSLFSMLCGVSVAMLAFVLLGSLVMMELIVFRGLSRLSGAITTVTSRPEAEKAAVQFRGNLLLMRISSSVNKLLLSRDLQHQFDSRQLIAFSKSDSHRKSMNLIQSLFPAHVFRALQQGTLPNESFAMASVMFCDIVDFKPWATATPPERVAEFLGGFIEGLDELVESCGVTKIKTILDLYMAVSGVPVETARHAHVVLGLALEFHKFGRSRSFDGSHAVGLRIGVSSGPVASGIIGKRNWVYDIWSDTVNMAARLKAKAQPGAVLCDYGTCELARDEFDFDKGLEMELKGLCIRTYPFPFVAVSAVRDPAHSLAAVLAVTFVFSTREKLSHLERGQAAQEAKTLFGVMNNQVAALKSLVGSYAWMDGLYRYMVRPVSIAWAMYTQDLKQRNLQAFFLVLPNGTMLRGLMWNANHTDTVAASPTFVQGVGANLAHKGVADGLYWIPETCDTSVIVVSQYVKYTNGTGNNVGWLVLAQNVQTIVPQVAQVADICVALTHSSYLAIGMVLSDEVGEGTPRVNVLIRGIRNDAPTIESTTRFMVVICCCSLFAIFVLVCLLMEFFVLRILATLSNKIVDVSAHTINGERLEVTGKSELRNVNRAVNELLAALETKTEQTEHILRSIYPEEVLGRIKRGESNNLTFPEATVLFVDICNFTLWSSALTPDVVTKYLNGLFSAMDEVVHREGLTKVATIGDAYIVVSGMRPGQSNNAMAIAAIAFKFTRHPLAACRPRLRSALAPRMCYDRVMDHSDQPLAFRMGIATGQCSSAMIGRNKKFFELWGPSVTLSQQLQESASPGEVVCCAQTRLALQAANGDAFQFVPHGEVAAEDGGPARQSWRLVIAARDTPRTETDSQRSLSSTGLLSIMAEDAGIAFLSYSKESLCGRFLRSLRFGAVVGVAALMAVAVVALVVFLMSALAGATAELMDRRAVVDITRASHALQSSLDALKGIAAAWAGWENAAEFIADENPNGFLWQSLWANGLIVSKTALDGGVFLTLNGTVVNGIGYDYPSGAHRNISAAELAVLRGFLVGRRITTGLLYDPVSGVARAVVVYPVMNSDDDPVTGWLVFYRDIKRLLPTMAQMTHMCLGALQTGVGTTGPLASLWDVSGTVPPGSAASKANTARVTRNGLGSLDGASYACPSGGSDLLNSTVTFEGAVLRDLRGERGLLLFAMCDPQPLAEERSLFAMLCGVCVAMLALVLLGSEAVMELVVFRGLWRLSKAITTVTSKSETQRATVQFKGNLLLRRISDSVNALLLSRDLQHQKSLDLIQSLFPPHVFRALQQGNLPNESFAMASVMFCDIVGFKAWATATPPEAVAEFLGSYIDGLDQIVDKCGATKIKTILDMYSKRNWVYDIWSDTVNMVPDN